MGAKREVIRWSVGERFQVLSRAAEIVGDGAVPVSELIRRSQEVLPVGRRRGSALTGKDRAKFMEQVKRFASMRDEGPKPEPVKIEAIPTEEPVPSGLEAELIAAGARVLAGILSSPDVRSALEGLVRVAMGREAAVVASGDPWSETAGKGKPRVVIAGLERAQPEVIKGLSGGGLDLRFWRTSQSGHQLRALCDGADAAVGVVKFLSHSAEGIMKARAKRYVRVAGGMTDLTFALRDLADELRGP